MPFLNNQFKVSQRYCARAGGIMMEEHDITPAPREPTVQMWVEGEVQDRLMRVTGQKKRTISIY